MDNKYYILSKDEYDLLDYYCLNMFVKHVPTNPYNGWYDAVIPYDFIDDLVRVIYSEKSYGAHYSKLLCFAERLQEILEVNDHS